MKKSIVIAIVVFLISSLHAQVGINTTSPQGWLHIDAGVLGNGSDDVIVKDVTGVGVGVGVGTLNPANKLTIASTSSNTGLHLPVGAAAGRVLTSDVAGNALWMSGAKQHQTLVYSQAGPVEWIYDASSGVDNRVIFPNFRKIPNFNDVVMDGAKDEYGSAYGWNVGSSHYVAPVSGVYRIAFAVYFQGTSASLPGVTYNYRAYAYILRGVESATNQPYNLLQPGIISVTFSTNEIASYVMGLCHLEKDDVLDIRLSSSNTGEIGYYGGPGHTYVLIESL